MPELPEVETVARALRDGTPAGAPALVGHVICSAEVLWPRELGNLTPRVFSRRISGTRVQSIGRYGKYLLIGLERPAVEDGNERLTLLIHLKMSGRLDVVPRTQAFTPHARLVWLLDDDLALRFDDARKFGRVWLVGDPAAVIGNLGPDALDVPLGAFTSRLRARRGMLKPVLLDQTFLAGIGNIYADEALHLARLHPRRTVTSLSDADVVRLHDAIQHVLLAGIAANGASFDWVYPGGNFQENFKVYGRTGRPCQTCGEPIQRILVAQRGTHFCPACQPLIG
ncbi:MAG: bifunctional DNA-formamidopyrimidine glycosylase/DNA-(apurinic or apyrimidinic site) lyase [Anaerolineae bacterium]|nr:bifunctional DNA-formamidopyrimidine glycosylase/DNA-(apurinic or apyrimidinic site) lyase [Anaerolineae bacterium]